jgi:hypothetical protein
MDIQNSTFVMKFDILTDVMLCCVKGMYQYFGQTCFLRLQTGRILIYSFTLKTQAGLSYEMFGNSY